MDECRRHRGPATVPLGQQGSERTAARWRSGEGAGAPPGVDRGAACDAGSKAGPRAYSAARV